EPGAEIETVPKRQRGRTEAGEVNYGAVKEGAFKQVKGLPAQVAAPGVGPGMRGRLQAVVGSAERPIQIRALDGIRHDRPVTRSAFQVVEPGRLRRFAGCEGGERTQVIVHRRIVSIVAAGHLVKV